MYSPALFFSDDEQQVRNLIAKNSFATVISFSENQEPYINHFPFIFSEKKGEEKILISHMAKRNPQWQHFKSNPKAILIFNGPNGYITPSWYSSGRDVPTWNYAVAHLYGRMEVMETYADLVDVLKQVSGYFESFLPKQWEFELPSDLNEEAKLTSAIVGFRFHTAKIEAKFKLSQNRPKEDRIGVIEGLTTRKDNMSQALAELMIEVEKNLK